MTKNIFVTYLVATAVFFAIDMVWLGVIAKNLYKRFLGGLMTDHVIWWAAILFYLLFIVGLLIFAILPALNAGSWQYALTYGALFGLFTYATYDLTNYATLKGFPFVIVPIDIAWGMIVSGSVSVATYFIVKMLP